MRTDGNGRVVVTGGTFRACEAGGSGGAFAAFGGALNVSGTAFEGNLAGLSGGAVALEATSSGLFSGTTMTLNAAKDAGGAVAVLGGGSVTDTGVNPRVDFSAARMTANWAARGGAVAEVCDPGSLRPAELAPPPPPAGQADQTANFDAPCPSVHFADETILGDNEAGGLLRTSTRPATRA